MKKSSCSNKFKKAHVVLIEIENEVKTLQKQLPHNATQMKKGEIK